MFICVETVWIDSERGRRRGRVSEKLNEMDVSSKSTDEVVQEIMKINRSLPTRPGIEEVEAAKTLVRNMEMEDQSRLETIEKQKKGSNVPEEIFMVFREMQRNYLYFQSKEQKREALKLLDLENAHHLFDELIQRASTSLSPNSAVSTNSSSLSFSGRSSDTFTTTSTTTATSTSSLFSEKEPARPAELFSRDDSYLKTGTRSVNILKPQIVDSSFKSSSISGEDGEKLSMIKLANLIEVSSKKGTKDLNLQNKLMDQIVWLPDSIGKLSTSLITLDLSENRIITLPPKIGNLSMLKTLDLHANKISELPDIIGNLFNLVNLNLRGNQLTSVPESITKLVRLEELDLSSNQFTLLPDAIGSLVTLKKLDLETNGLEELPHTIGKCSSLVELRIDYNRIKAIPEAVGRIASLEILSVRYNNIKQLPTTMSSMSSLKELNVSFNELECVPESLCFATKLTKLNVSNNFADLQRLPRSIGNLELLEVLDVSNNQIRTIPESVRMLSNLRVLNLEGNPIEVLPREIVDQGAQAVVQYMADMVAKKEMKLQPIKLKKSWVNICFFSKSNKRKRNEVDCVKAA